MSLKKLLMLRAGVELHRYVVLYYALIRRNFRLEAYTVNEAAQMATEDLLTSMRQTGALHVGTDVNIVYADEDKDVPGVYRLTLEVSAAYAAEAKVENAVAAIEATTFECGDADWCGGWCDRSWVAVVKNENGAIVWDDADTVRRYTADFGAP